MSLGIFSTPQSDFYKFYFKSDDSGEVNLTCSPNEVNRNEVIIFIIFT